MPLPVWNLQHPDFYRVILANYPAMFPNGQDRMANSIAAENTAIAGLADAFTRHVKQAVETTHRGHKAAYRQSLQQAMDFYDKTLGGVPAEKDFQKFLARMPEGYEHRLPPHAAKGLFNLLLSALLVKNRVVDDAWLTQILDQVLAPLRSNIHLPFQVPKTAELGQQIRDALYKIAGKPDTEIIPEQDFDKKASAL